MNITPIVTGDIPFVAIVYKYNYWRVLGFISDEGYGSTDPGDTYLSCFPENYTNIYFLPVVSHRVLVSHFNGCN